MTDSLRDRIAAAVFHTRVNQGDPIVTMVDCNGIADAVIAALLADYDLVEHGTPLAQRIAQWQLSNWEQPDE